MRILGSIAVPALLVVALAGCTPTPAPAPSATPPASGPTTCADADLLISLTGGEGAAGSIYYELVFQNVGTVDCTLAGYPQAWVSSTTEQFGAAATQVADLPTDPITLHPDDSVYSTLQVTNIDAGGGPLGTDCAVVAGGTGYSITAPGAATAQHIEVGTVPACGNAGATWMTVTPVSPTSALS